MKKNIFQKEAKKAFLIELEELKAFSKSKNFNVEELCTNISNCKGKIFITGVGKSGHIANKFAATLSSTGTPSFFIHPAEALHGDLGMIEKNDAILAISKSGESKEICDLIPAIKMKKIDLFSITENVNSTIARASITHILVKVKREACPGGKLGKKLTLRTKDLMVPIKKAAVVKDTETIKDLIFEVSEKKQGIALVKKGAAIVGVFSDGDLRRQLQKNVQIDKVKLSSVLTKKIKTINSEELVVKAAEKMKSFKVYTLVVEENKKVVGILTMHDILEANVI